MEKGKVGQERVRERGREKLSHRTTLLRAAVALPDFPLIAFSWYLNPGPFGFWRPAQTPQSPQRPIQLPDPSLTPCRGQENTSRAKPERLFYFACWHAAGDQDLHNGKHSRTQEKAAPAPLSLFPYRSILPLSTPSPFSSSSFLFSLRSPLAPTCSILFLPLCTLPPLLFVIYLFGPTRLGTFITDSLDTILKPSHQQHNGTVRAHRHTKTHGRTHTHRYSVGVCLHTPEHLQLVLCILSSRTLMEECTCGN